MTREQFLVGNSIVNGVLAADCLFNSDGNEPEAVNKPGYLDALAMNIAGEVSPNQVENMIAVLTRIQVAHTSKVLNNITKG